MCHIEKKKKRIWHFHILYSLFIFVFYTFTSYSIYFYYSPIKYIEWDVIPLSVYYIFVTFYKKNGHLLFRLVLKLFLFALFYYIYIFNCIS
jgi:hypothetical protein